YTESLGCVSGDGKSVVFSSNRTGNFNLWKLVFGASDQQQLTRGQEVDSQPTCSPDGKWVLFRSFRQGKPTFWKVALAGGEPQQLIDKSASWAAISPDGNLVAVSYFDENGGVNRIAILPFAGGAPIKTLEFPGNFREAGLGWTADSRAIVY